MSVPARRLTVVGGESARAKPLLRGVTPTLALATELQNLGQAPRTVSIYLNEIRRAEAFCQARGHRLSTAPPDLIARYVDTRPRSHSTRKAIHAALKHYWVLTNRKNPPLAVIRVPQKPAAVCRAVDEDEARIIGRHLRQRRDLPGLATAIDIWLGLRREETARLDLLDFRGKFVRVFGKGQKERTIPVHPVVLELIALQPQMLPLLPRQGGYLFPGRVDGHVHPNTIWDWVKKVCADAGVEGVTPHRLRHTCLATMHDNTGNLRATQEFAGHSRPETTAGYTRVRMKAMQAGIDSLDY